MAKGRNLHIPCDICDEELNTWDVRACKALGYKKVLICEKCICEEYACSKEFLRNTLNERFGLVPCQGL